MNSDHSGTPPALNFDGSDSGNKPKGRVGRKRKDTLPLDAKHQRSLEAQRAFRQRRQDHILRLEAQVAALQQVVDGRSAALPGDAENALLKQQLLAATAENALLRQHGVAIDLRSSVPQSLGEATRCTACSVEKLKTLLCMGQIKAMEGKQAEMMAEMQALRALVSSLNINTPMAHAYSGDTSPAFSDFDQEWNDLFNSMQTTVDPGATAAASSSSSSSTTHTNSFNTPILNMAATPQETPMTATELYGPPECEFAKIALRSIPSIKDLKEIDEIFDTFTVVSSCVDLNRIRKHMIRMMRCRTKLLDTCAVMDRQKVIEIFVIFLERNKRHSEHRNNLTKEFFSNISMDPATYAAQKANFVDTPEAKRFRASLNSIPALQNPESESAITRLCMLLCTPCPPGKESEIFDLCVKYRKLLDTKMTTASLEDKTRLNMAMEISRYAHNTFANLMVEDVSEDGGEEKAAPMRGVVSNSNIGSPYGFGSVVQTPLSHLNDVGK
ncbi:hypothetical protein HDU98_010768 [Podochytrium sp. JEL0797]|nr:hypothetical protein HDU98_010768 [Podochytrium sp. JEL0797]